MWDNITELDGGACQQPSLRRFQRKQNVVKLLHSMVKADTCHANLLCRVMLSVNVMMSLQDAQLDAFKGFQSSLEQTLRDWKKWYSCAEPEKDC
eukprot:5085737-Amphidinium_carterae.1